MRFDPTHNKKQTELSTMWFDDDGIFHTVTRKDASVTKEMLMETFAFIHEQAGDQKICWLGDVTEMSFPTDEARDFAGEVTPKFVKALALVTNSKLSRIIANVYLTLKKPSYPTRMFTNKENAREWLKQYL